MNVEINEKANVKNSVRTDVKTGGKFNGKIYAIVALCLCALAATVFGLPKAVKPAEAASAEITAEIIAGATRGGKKYHAAYVGETLDKELIARNTAVYEVTASGGKGSAITVSAANVGDDADLSEEGETSVTITAGGGSVSVPVYVYRTETIEPLSPDHILSWASAFNFYFESQISGGEATRLATTNILTDKQYGIDENLVVLRVPTLHNGDEKYVLHTVGQTSEKQMLCFFSGINAGNLSSLPVGSVLEFNDNFRFYRYIDETYIAAYRLSEVAKYVWTGSEWTNFVADTVDFSLSADAIELPAGASYPLDVKLLPEGSYIAASMVSSDDTVAKIENGMVRCLKAGTADITVTVGKKSAKISVTVTNAEANGFKLMNDRVFYVSRNGTFDLSKVSVAPDFGGGVYGDAFSLGGDNATISLDTSVVGKTTAEISVSEGGVSGKIPVTVEVVDVTEQIPSGFWSAEDSGNFFGAIVVHFSGTFRNPANVYLSNLTAEQKAAVLGGIEFARKGVTAEITNVEFMTSLLTIDVKIDGKSVKSYREGDVLTLKRGLPFYSWTGETVQGAPKGDGDFVQTGVATCDIRYVYGKNGKFNLDIQYTDAVAVEKVVRLGIGETAPANVKMIPSYATVGEWFFVSEDPSVADVDVNGKITAKSAGKTTIYAYLEGGALGELSVSFGVEVADEAESFFLNAESITIAVGTDLTGEYLAAKGIYGYVSYRSGKVEKINLAGVTLGDFDENAIGTQTVSVLLTDGEKSSEAYLTVIVKEAEREDDSSSDSADSSSQTETGSEGKQGCKGSVGCGVAAFISFALFAVLIKKRRNATND